jgi:hypothetical protein
MSQAESLALPAAPAVGGLEESAAMTDRIVSIGLLTERDLERLGDGFRRHIPITSDDMFADLMAKLDRIPFDPSHRSRSNKAKR